MTALEAVAILESAVLECKKRETSLNKGQAPGGAGVESYLLKKSLMIADDGGDYSDNRNRAACWRPFFLRRKILDLSSLFIKLFSLPPHKIYRISH